MNSFNKFSLRRLYNIDHAGRGEQGTVRRKEFKITVRPATYLALRSLIEVGPGQYGSSVMELCLRTMLASMGALNHTEFNKVAEELSVSINDRAVFARNLMTLASMVAAYKGEHEELEEPVVV